MDRRDRSNIGIINIDTKRRGHALQFFSFYKVNPLNYIHMRLCTFAFDEKIHARGNSRTRF